MGFRLAKERAVWWPCVVHVPTDGGGTAEYTFEARLKLLPSSKIYAPALTKQDDDALLAAHVLDWRGLEDEEGRPIPFSPENLAAVLEVGYVRRALNLALIEASTGAPGKNLSRGSAGSQTPTA